MKKYICAYEEDYIKDDEITQVLIKAIEKGDMKYFTEWNAFAWLSGYFGTEPQNLKRILNCICYVFEECPDIKNAEYLRPIEDYDRYN